MNQRWTKDELNEAFELHAATVAGAAASGDWEPFVQLFLPDATYVDPMVGVMRGHEQIRPWVTATLGTFPGSAMHYPEAWHLVDPERGRIVCELRNVLRDPGDGSTFEENNISILEYAGDGRFRSERDVYDSAAMVKLIESWGRRSAELGTLDEEERAWFSGAYPHILQPSDG
ncbi:nuclear transport factor 2 family protein [Cryptosporangium minutisporangium]|uniref:Nuclear transport factor 2 family protein n=1 Tax=Cryptosporangium minutisporangium TaxID=113569 RepID=A0ABP6SR51_9ACTN